MYSLGLEFSTQSAKMVLLDLNECRVAYGESFDYDSRFPEYRTQGGVLPGDVPAVRHTSPFMLLEALDHAFRKMLDDGLDLSSITVIKTDGMQHCSVYTDHTFEQRLRTMDASRSLITQLGPSISRKTSPIWEDRSPVEETAYLIDALEAQGGIERLTGNRAELRFPAAQILKWARESMEEYEQTVHILVLSAFITAILRGGVAPVDTGDGWGTNLNHLDIDHPGWSDPDD